MSPDIPVSNAVIGGLIMGAGAGLLLVGSGRTAGIGGAFERTLVRDIGTSAWRLWFLGGIVLGGLLAGFVYPSFFDMSAYDRPLPLVLLSGLIMGVGSRMCSGCTSGHGVCGIARLSTRSLIATCVFFGTTLLSLYVGRHLLGLF